MAQILDALETRITDILQQARGQSGLGTDAAARYLPSGRFRRDPYRAPLTDPQYDAAKFDRAFEIDWQSTEDVDGNDPENDLDVKKLLDVRWTLNVGYVYGKEVPQFIDVATGTGETASVAVVDAKKRALSDMETIRRALTFLTIYSGDLGNGITLYAQYRTPRTATTLRDLGNGRLIASMQMMARLEYTAATRYDP